MITAEQKRLIVKALKPLADRQFVKHGQGPNSPEHGGPDKPSNEDDKNKSPSSIADLRKEGFNIIGLDDLDPSVVAPLATELMKLKEISSDLPKQMGAIRAKKLPSGTPFTYQTEFSQRTFLIDPSQLSGKALDRTIKTIERSQKNGWLASKGGLRGVIAHEFGHTLDKTPFNYQKDFNVNVSKSKIYIKKNPPTKKDLSGYGTEDGPHQKEEAFAEAYSAYRTNPNPTKWQQGFNAALESR